MAGYRRGICRPGNCRLISTHLAGDSVYSDWLDVFGQGLCLGAIQEDVP